MELPNLQAVIIAWSSYEKELAVVPHLVHQRRNINGSKQLAQQSQDIDRVHHRAR